MRAMEPQDIIKYCHKSMEGTVCVNAWGEEGIFYNPANVLKRGVYIMTVKQKDGENDKGSYLDRPGIYRVNTGIGKKKFKEFFGFIPERPAAGKIVDMKYDFTETNRILPHPVYAWMGWVCVLNPTEETFRKFYPLIQDAYELGKKKFEKRVKSLK